VFVTPGNHDPWSDSSPTWCERLLRVQRGDLGWPANVHVFQSPEWSVQPLPGHPLVRIWGRCWTAKVESLERPLAKDAMAVLSPPDPGGFDVALFHGSHEAQCPPGQKIAGPFSDEELERAPFAYLAVGHYHAAARIAADDARGSGVRLAYAGSTVALSHAEVGVHGACEVVVQYGDGRPRVELELVPLDPRRVDSLTVDVQGCTAAEAVDRAVESALDEAGLGEADIVSVRLEGRWARGVRYGGPSPELAARCFHLRVDVSGVRPDYDLEALAEPKDTTEDRFVRTLLDRRDRATDPEERALIESALYYGLDAFRLREVVPAYEDLA
jgi:hypothetical protein